MIGDTKFQYRETKNLFDELFHKGELCECGHHLSSHYSHLHVDGPHTCIYCLCVFFKQMSNLTYLTTRPNGGV